VPIHGGPGGKFYETGKLRRGARVIVHRHDPGGWYMVAPPADEFSLVKADEIRQIGNGVAEVTADEASVRVGSRTSDRHDVEQVPLARGDRVQVVSGVPAPNGWVAIRPPRGEYRWVPGQYLVPVPDAARAQHDSDPFAVPSAAKRPDSFDGAVAGIGPAPVESTPALRPPEPVSQVPGAVSASDALRRLDRDLEGLALSEPTDWPLDELADGYRKLREANPSAGRQIDVRLAQIERMRSVKQHYTDYVQLTSATDQRDATLLTKQLETSSPRAAGQAAEPSPAGPQAMLAPPMRLPGSPDAAATPLPPSAPPAEPQASPGTSAVAAAPGTPRPTAPNGADSGGPLLAPPNASLTSMQRRMPSAAPPATVPPQAIFPQQPATVPGTPQRFDAVGIVQKAVDPHPEAPKHVLVAPNGQILAYLRAQPGIPLEQFVGRPMGVDGQRHRHPELKTPMILVERLTPVRF
jgi:hypothetical protein